nr:hypothetical protein CFP56_61865 [Quercus suber]
MPLKLQTDGAKKTGCFNTACPGFVQVDNRYYTGSPLSNVSNIIDGRQFEIALSISKEEDGNWWLTRDGNRIGYYPAAIFNNLTEPETVGWGGIAVSPPNGISPPWDLEYFQMTIINIQVSLDRSSIEIVLEC